MALLISFFTSGTIYEKEVEDLKLSCQALGIECYIEARDDLGSWEKNCCQKPQFILECLERFQRSVLWVDADAIILQRPLFQMGDADLAIYFNDFEKKTVRSGTMYVASSASAKDFMCAWYQSCLQTFARLGSLPFGDQGQLPNLLLQNTIKVTHLPVEYVHIFDRDGVPLEKTVILHSQASRTAEMHPFMWKHLSGKDLKKMRMECSSKTEFRH